MAGLIIKEPHQHTPFSHVEEEVFLNVQWTADVMMQEILNVLRPYGLSVTQYNVLRILRSTGESGVTCKELGARMITRDPDITRLLDRLERRKLLTRSRAQDDRRFVAIRITQGGLELLRELDQPMAQKQLALMQHMGKEQLFTAIELMERMRAPLPARQ